MEELHGRQGSRLLRRDYGLFEATFAGEPAWRCSSIIVEVHRLASTEDVAGEMSQVEGLDLPSYIPWADVREALNVSGTLMPVRQSGRDGDYEVFRVPGSAVTVHVMADSESRRSVFPGPGDVWSISLSRLG